MKKKLILLFLSILLILSGFFVGHYKKFLIHKIFQKTITVEEFLNIKDKNKMNELYINKDGNIEFKKKVVVKGDTFMPLKDENVDIKEELAILYFSGWYKSRGFDLDKMLGNDEN